MKTYYLDANVFLARFAPGSREHEDAKRLVVATEEGQLRAVTSSLSLLQIASAVARAGGKGSGRTGENVAGAFVRRALSMRNLIYVPLGSETRFGTGVFPVSVPLVFAAGLKAASTLPLNMVELLHLASAYLAVRVHGEELGFFATLDENVLGMRREVKEFLDCPVVTPSELVNLEAL